MAEDYRSDGPEASVTISTPTKSGTVETCLKGFHRSVPLPRVLTDYEKAIWKRYGSDTDSFGPSLNLFADWIMRLRDSLDVLEDSAQSTPPEVEGRLCSVIHMMRRAFDDFDVMLQLAHTMIPHDPTVLRRIEKVHGPLLSSSLPAKPSQDSANQEQLQ